MPMIRLCSTSAASARLNFPDQLNGAAAGADRPEVRKEGVKLMAVAIRKKAAEVSARVDALLSSNGRGVHLPPLMLLS
jgi:hypothetical protein